MLSEEIEELGGAPDEIAEVYGGVASTPENKAIKKDRYLEVVESQNRSSQTNDGINTAKFGQHDADNWSTSLHSVLDQPGSIFSPAVDIRRNGFFCSFWSVGNFGEN